MSAPIGAGLPIASRQRGAIERLTPSAASNGGSGAARRRWARRIMRASEGIATEAAHRLTTLNTQEYCCVYGTPVQFSRTPASRRPPG